MSHAFGWSVRPLACAGSIGQQGAALQLRRAQEPRLPPLRTPAVLIAGALVAALACAVALASLCRYIYCGQLSAGGLDPSAGAGALTALLATQPPEPAGTEGKVSRTNPAMEACCFPLASCLPLSRAAGRPSSMLPLCSSLWGVVWPAGPHAASAQRRRRLSPRLAALWQQLLPWDARRQQRQRGSCSGSWGGRSAPWQARAWLAQTFSYSSCSAPPAHLDNVHNSLVQPLPPPLMLPRTASILPQLRRMPACSAHGTPSGLTPFPLF